MKEEAIMLFLLLASNVAFAEQPSMLTNPDVLKMAVIEPGYSGVFIILQNETGGWVVGYTFPGRNTSIYFSNETGYVTIQNNQTDQSD
ncbi:MAG: hypothetical protein PHQ34_11675 [Methanothrix sp.]|nr:hypothetical protein [Methanothrix sp.]